MLQKAKKNYSKEKAAEYYLLNRKAIRKRYKNITEKEKQGQKEYQKNYQQKIKAYKDDLLLEKAKEVKKVANYYQKKKKCKSMSKSFCLV